MKFRTGYNPLIIVGSWNKAIFSPDWVSQYIFPNTEIHIEFPFNNSNASIKFNAKNIALNVIDQRLLFYTALPSNESFDLIGEIATSLCRFLPHTPVSSFGINHVFESAIDEINESKIFELSDNNLIADNGYTIQSIKTVRTIKLEDCILNLSCSQENETIIFDFNYHYNISSLEEFIQKFDSQNISQKKDNALEFLSNIYELHLDNTNNYGHSK